MTTWRRTRIAVDDTAGFDHWRLDSGAPGPRVVVLGGIHGDEIEGALAAGRLTAMPLDLRRGVLDVVPVSHEAAFRMDRRTGPADDGNLARVFPGDRSGEPTARLAWHLTHEVLEGCDLLIDLHTSGQSYDMPFLAGFRRSDRDPDAIGERAAAAIAPDFLWHHPHPAPGRSLSVVDVGIYVECPGGGPVDLAYVERYTAGVMRVLATLGMVDDAPPPPEGHAPVLVTGGGNLDRDMVSVDHAGVFVHAVRAGDAVDAGQVLGTVVTERGEPVQELRAVGRGRVMAVKRRSSVDAGDLVVCIAEELDGGSAPATP